MICFIVSDILLFPIGWLPSWIFARGSVGHNCWRFTCFVHSHKLMYCFWNNMCICKASKVIGTSGNSAAISDFWHTSMCDKTGSTTIRKFDPENIGVAVGILSLCALELDICLGVFPLLPHLPAKVAKNRCQEKV